jgi:hypothetical protein
MHLHHRRSSANLSQSILHFRKGHRNCHEHVLTTRKRVRRIHSRAEFVPTFVASHTFVLETTHMAKTLICSNNAKLQSQKPEAIHDVMTRRKQPTVIATLQATPYPRLLQSMATKTTTVASHPLSLLVSLTCSYVSPACTHACLLPETQDTTRSMHRFNSLACITSSPSPHTHRCTQHACCIPSCPQQHAWYLQMAHVPTCIMASTPTRMLCIT